MYLIYQVNGLKEKRQIVILFVIIKYFIIVVGIFICGQYQQIEADIDISSRAISYRQLINKSHLSEKQNSYL